MGDRPLPHTVELHPAVAVAGSVWAVAEGAGVVSTETGLMPAGAVAERLKASGLVRLFTAIVFFLVAIKTLL